MPRHAHAATISIGDDEYTRTLNEVTIHIDPYNSVFFDDGAHSWVPERVEGLSTEDRETNDELSSDEGFLTCDGVVYRDGDDVVISGMTGFHGSGESVKTHIPIDAVELEWACDIDEYRNQKRHEWTEFFDSDEVFTGPPSMDIL